MDSQNITLHKTMKPDYSNSDDFAFYDEYHFKETVIREAKRSYRSKNTFLVVMIDITKLLTAAEEKGINKSVEIIEKIISAMHASTREIDIKGWYRTGDVLGVICLDTDINSSDIILNKIHASLKNMLSHEFTDKISLRYKQFPGDTGAGEKTRVILLNELIYDDNEETSLKNKCGLAVKRCLDVTGSLCAILIFSPFFILIPLLIKISSKGPVLFKQNRVGQNGRVFNFLKFRSMHVNNNDSIHKEFIAKLIKGDIKTEEGEQKNAYKIKNDPRVTKIGRIIRKTSLDELPQLFNVLMGDMSLVGPRPPIPYEVEKYDLWHTRRVVDFKPGITGFWQVEGRSNTTFDSMVRMDLYYTRYWSLWLDLKLIIKTPVAMLAAKGAC